MLDREQEKCEEFTCQLTNLNAQLGAVAQEVTRLTDDQEELLTAHEAIKSKRDSLAEQVEELTESMAVLEEDRDTLRELGAMIEEKLAIGEKVTNRTLEGALSEKGKVVEQAKSVEQLQETSKKQLEVEIETMSSSNGSLSKKLEQVTKQLQETSNKIEVLEANVEEQSKIITAKDTEIRGDPTEPASCRAIDADEATPTLVKTESRGNSTLNNPYQAFWRRNDANQEEP
ncbi:enhancer of polycomb [Culex quinquefasciatus]|uniref:Enhancer of polycomb n=1 Tax=Culex quinquefasciatus TaxID=7176 RepID=B0W9R9_CULQU|nr:enhancer of polycomb [Culex quinquefasciatus]|eukprot:XP_001845453.1 enhancer of polycomb [Culex quinquefasciatus]